MPFQGNVNAGGIDPQLMSMLFQARKDRAQLAIDQQKAQMEAQRQAKQEERDDMIFRADMAKKMIELRSAQSESSAELSPKLDLALDQSAEPFERQAGGASYIQGLQERAQMAAGIDSMGNPNPVTGDILNRIGTEAAAAGALKRAEARSASPNLDWEYDQQGNKRRVIVGEGGRMTPVPGAVWVPPKAGVTVNVGGEGGLDLNQIAIASDRERTKFSEKMAPFEAIDNAISTLESFRSMADKNGMLPYEANQFVSSDVMAAMRGEALNEGDVKRLTSVGLWNAAKSWIGVPPQMTVLQTEMLADILRDRAKRKEKKRSAIIREGIRRADSFGFDPYLIVGDYADEQTPSKDRDGNQSDGRITPRDAAAEGLP